MAATKEQQKQEDQKRRLKETAALLASLSTCWFFSEQINAVLGHEGQSLTDVISEVGSDPGVDDETLELLKNMDAFNALGGDIISVLIPVVLYSAYGAYLGMNIENGNTKLAAALAIKAFGIAAGHAIAYAGSKAILSQMALTTITVTNPLMHIPLAITFALFYAVFSTVIALTIEFQIMNSLLRGGGKVTSFGEFLVTKKAYAWETFFVNFSAGLGLYFAGWLTPQINTGVKEADTALGLLTTVGLTAGGGTAVRAGTYAWRKYQSSKSHDSSVAKSSNNNNNNNSHNDEFNCYGGSSSLYSKTN